jgi:hypothetical protein
VSFIVTDDDLAGMEAWRMGPWRDRHERWDLTPVSDLGLAKEESSALFLAGIYTAGHLDKALAKRRRPTVLRLPALREAAKAVLAKIRAQTESDRLAIEVDLAEIAERNRARLAARQAGTEGDGAA